MEVRLYLLLTVYVSNKIVTWQEVVKWNVYRELLFLFFNSYFSSFFFSTISFGKTHYMGREKPWGRGYVFTS